MATRFFLTAGPDPAGLEHRDPCLSLADDNLTGLFRCIRRYTDGACGPDGPSLDEYGSSVFVGPGLSQLSAALSAAASGYERGEAEISVLVGEEVLPLQRAVYESVSRERILEVIARIKALADEAVRTRQCLHVDGD